MTSLAISTYLAPNNWEFIKGQTEKFQVTDVNKKRALDMDSMPQGEQEVKKFKFQSGSNGQDVQKQISIPLPTELIFHVLSFLRPEDLGQAARVCREWRTLAYDDSLWRAIEKRLPSLYPSLTIIDAAVWKTHVDLDAFGLNVEDPLPGKDAQPLSKRVVLISILRAKKEMALKIEGYEGVTLLTIPEGLTFNKLVEIAKSPKQANPRGFSYISDHVSEVFGNSSSAKIYRIVISNSILKGSRGESGDAQQALVANLSCEMHGVLEVSTLAVLTYMVSSTCLYSSNDPLTFTHCSEKINGKRLVVGSDQGGLYVYDRDLVHPYLIGAGIQRKLPGIGT